MINKRSFLKRLGALSVLLFVKPGQAVESVGVLAPPDEYSWWSSNINGASEALTLETLQEMFKRPNPMSKPDYYIVSLSDYRRNMKDMRQWIKY